MRNQPLQIGFIGTGTMGAMLIRALLRANTVSATNIWAANRSQARLESLAAEFTGLHSADSSRVAAASEILFLCVKPADVPDVLQQIRNQLRDDQVCVFLTNVFSFQEIEARIPCRAAKLIPTIAQQVARGVALLSYGARIARADSIALENLLSATGRVLVVPEKHLRIFADVASCGPAFLAACIEELCLQAAKKAPGVSASDLTKAAIETLAATAELLRSGLSPGDLVRQVAVPGGMTEAGLRTLRQSLPQQMAPFLEATVAVKRGKRETTSFDLRR